MLIATPSLGQRQARMDSLLNAFKQINESNYYTTIHELVTFVETYDMPIAEKEKAFTQALGRVKKLPLSKATKLLNVWLLHWKIQGSFQPKAVNRDSSILYYQKVKKLYTEAIEANNTLLKADAGRALSSYFAMLENYEESISYALASSSIYEKLGHHQQAVLCLVEISHNNYKAGNMELALKYMLKAEELGLRQHRYSYMYLNTIGLALRNLGRNAEAIESFEEVLEITKAVGDSVWIGLVMGNIGDVYLTLKQYEKARPLLEKDAYYSLKHGARANAIITLNRLGDVHQMQGQFEQAKRYYDQAISLLEAASVDIADTEAFLLTYTNLSSFHARFGSYDSAYYYDQKLLAVKDSLHQKNVTAKVLKVQNKFDLAQKQQELNQFKKETELQQNLQRLEFRIISGGFIAVMIFLAMVYHNYLRQKKTSEALLNQKKRIEEQNNEITTQNEEMKSQSELLIEQNETITKLNYKLAKKVEESTQQLNLRNDQFKTFLYQTSHRLVSPLTSLKGLNDIIMRLTTQDGVKESVLHSNQVINRFEDMLRKISHVIEIEYDQQAVEAFDLLTLVHKTITYFLDKTSRYQSIAIHTEVPNTPIILNSEKIFFRILIESILENAFDFSLIHSNEKAQVALSVQEETHAFLIKIEDNGPGIDHVAQVFKPFFVGHEASKGNGIGLYIAHLAALKTGVTIDFTTSKLGGTTVTLTVPKSLQVKASD